MAAATMPGHRWKWKRRDGVEVVFEIEDTGSGGVHLRQVRGSGRRFVDTERLYRAYEYVGDFTIPTGYKIVELKHSRGYHCFVDPFGSVTGPEQGKRWTWQQARDAAKRDAEELARRLSGRAG